MSQSSDFGSALVVSVIIDKSLHLTFWETLYM